MELFAHEERIAWALGGRRWRPRVATTKNKTQRGSRHEPIDKARSIWLSLSKVARFVFARPAPRLCRLSVPVAHARVFESTKDGSLDGDVAQTATSRAIQYNTIPYHTRRLETELRASCTRVWVPRDALLVNSARTQLAVR